MAFTSGFWRSGRDESLTEVDSRKSEELETVNKTPFKGKELREKE